MTGEAPPCPEAAEATGFSREPRSLPTVLEALLAAAREHDLPAVLHHVVRSACTLLDARYAALGIIGEHGDRQHFITTGMTDEAERDIGTIPEGKGVLALLMKDARPIRLADLTQHPESYGFPPNHPPMKSFLGVPVGAHGRVFGNLYLTEKRTGDFTEEDERVALALAAGAALAIENAALYERAERRKTWLNASLELSQQLLSGLDRARAMELIAERAREVSGVDTVAIVVPAGNDHLVVEVAVGYLSGELLGRPIPCEGSLSGVVMRTGEPQFVEDLRRDPRLRDSGLSRLDLGSSGFYPLSAGEELLGVLVMANGRDRPPFSRLDRRLSATFATQAALAIELARGQERRTQLAVYEDRDRIALDLHDLAIQRIFAVGLSMQYLKRSLPEGEHSGRLQESIEQLDSAISDIRATIFALRRPSTGPATLPARLLRQVTESTAALGFTPRVRLSGPVEEVPDEVGEHLLAVVTEGLSNAARHAAAREVVVDVQASEHDVCASIRDNGCGLAADGRRSGLENLARRAARLGGEFTVDGSNGTLLVWRVPLSRRQE